MVMTFVIVQTMKKLRKSGNVYYQIWKVHVMVGSNQIPSRFWFWRNLYRLEKASAVMFDQNFAQRQ